MDLYRVEDLYKSYSIKRSRVDILKGISFTIEQGDFVAIVGRSGCGKTTLLHILAGLLKPNRGKVYYKGKSLYGLRSIWLPRYRNREIGYVFQDFQLLEKLNVYQNVALPFYFRHRYIHEYQKSIDRILKEVGLIDRRKSLPHQLSGGEAQRTAVARALVLSPPVLFCDEPTGNLDRQTEKELIRLLIDEQKRKGLTLIIATHSKEIEKKAQTVMAIEDGQINVVRRGGR